MKPGDIFETTRVEETFWNEKLQVMMRHTWGVPKGTRFVCMVVAIRPVGEFVDVVQVMDRFGWQLKPTKENKPDASRPGIPGASVAEKRRSSRRSRKAGK